MWCRLRLTVYNNYFNTINIKRICLFISFIICVFSAKAQDTRAILFDKDWRFKKDSLIQAESPDYNDAGWRKLDLPHDWSIEDLPNQEKDSVQGPFTKAAVSKGATGYTEGGIGWYRKMFTLGQSYAGKQTYILFEIGRASCRERV